MIASDQEVRTRIQNFLHAKGHSLSRLDVHVDAGTVCLTGSVSTFYAKQLAISCVQHVPHVHRVEVNVNVTDAAYA